ncbi:MAG: sugar phosphate isomerase/epimerase family protein [Acidimicrobiia bacterium]
MTSDRLSLNQKTTQHWTVEEAIAGCADAGIRWIGLWREHVAKAGLDRTAHLVRDAGIGVSSLCRGGFFPATSEAERQAAIEDNRRAVDEAVVLGTDTIVLVCGGLAGNSLDDARRQVLAGIKAVAPYAAEHGVRLAIEPLHPMFCADRSVIVTLAQALDVAEQFDEDTVGVVIDTFHLWWDPTVWDQIARAGNRIFSYQVCDWLDPLPDILMGRGMMGDGVIDFVRFSRAVAAAGYQGPIEVEIFNHAVWDTPGEQVLATMIERFSQLVVVPSDTGP